MRKLAAVLVLLFAVSLSAEEVLDNAAILRLLDASLSPDIVELKIEQSATSFDVTTDGLIALQKANVPDVVIKAMLRKSMIDAQPGRQAPPPVGAQAPPPVVPVNVDAEADRRGRLSSTAPGDQVCVKVSYYTTGVNGWSWYPANVCVTATTISLDEADIPLGQVTAHCLSKPFSINIGGRSTRGDQEWHFGSGQELYEIRGSAEDMRRIYDYVARAVPEVKHGEDCGARDIRGVLQRR